jgi:hypothetical protein
MEFPSAPSYGGHDGSKKIFFASVALGHGPGDNDVSPCPDDPPDCLG